MADPMKVQIHGITDETINKVLAHRASQTMKTTNPTASFTPDTLILPLQTVYRHPDMIAGGSGLCIASFPSAYPAKTREAMAAEIISKVNSHADLLAALEACADRLESLQSSNEDAPALTRHVHSQARAAIAKAKGVQS